MHTIYICNYYDSDFKIWSLLKVAVYETNWGALFDSRWRILGTKKSPAHTEQQQQHNKHIENLWYTLLYIFIIIIVMILW